MPEGKIVWRYPQVGRGNSWGGALTTAGELVFFANDSGALEAVEARSGRSLWQFTTGQGIYASPMSYAIDGVQYVAIAAGSDCDQLLASTLVMPNKVCDSWLRHVSGFHAMKFGFRVAPDWQHSFV